MIEKKQRTSHKKGYLDFSPFSRSFYVIDIDTAKQQRLSFPRKIGALLYSPAFSSTQYMSNRAIKEPAKSRLLVCCNDGVFGVD
jgi:hypothetical protein